MGLGCLAFWLFGVWFVFGLSLCCLSWCMLFGPSLGPFMYIRLLSLIRPQSLPHSPRLDIGSPLGMVGLRTNEPSQELKLPDGGTTGIRSSTSPLRFEGMFNGRTIYS